MFGIVLSSYFDKCLLQHTHYDYLTIISFLITYLYSYCVYICLVASMSVLTIPISKWDLPLMIHGM